MAEGLTRFYWLWTDTNRSIRVLYQNDWILSILPFFPLSLFNRHKRNRAKDLSAFSSIAWRRRDSPFCRGKVASDRWTVSSLFPDRFSFFSLFIFFQRDFHRVRHQISQPVAVSFFFFFFFLYSIPKWNFIKIKFCTKKFDVIFLTCSTPETSSSVYVHNRHPHYQCRLYISPVQMNKWK